MKEIVVISGKGGTGKTSVTAAFAALARNTVFADCDVDAADLHLILQPEIQQRNQFRGRDKARIIPEKCSDCGICLEHCRFDAIESEPQYHIDPISCEGCGVCQYLCPEEAVEMTPSISGEWYLSKTRFGPMVHAKLGIAEENSGKLVALVRMQAKLLAENRSSDYILIDGAPGVGCPVISCITGADYALVVTEPTVSGVHDMKRICELTKYFKIPTTICINKWDLHPETSQQIEKTADDMGVSVIGKIGYDRAFDKAQRQGLSIVEYGDGGAKEVLERIWNKIQHL